MITEDYCSFELSKLLKENGFDWDCEHYYKPNGEIVRSFHTKGSHHINSLVLYEHQCLAPTHQMAMKWLREQGIDIIILPVLKNEYNKQKYYIWQTTGRKDKASTYEEAVEAALKYCLTKLI